MDGNENENEKPYIWVPEDARIQFSQDMDGNENEKPCIWVPEDARIQFSQEAATSTQSVSSEGSSSNEEKMLITIQTDVDQSELTITDTLDSSMSNE